MSIQIAPLISEENRPQVHHMLVFICPTNSNIEEDGLCDVIANGTYFGCFGGQIISAWAIGGEVSAIFIIIPSNMLYILNID